MSETRSLMRSEAIQPQLEIVEGLHTGVRLDLDDGEYSLGPTPNCDIVLRDKGVLPQHAVLRIERGQVRVEATGGDLLVGEVKVTTGHGCHVRMPAVITLGEAALRLSRGAETDATLFSRMRTATKGLSNRPMEVAGSVLFCAVAVAALSHLPSQSTPESERTQIPISTETVPASLADDNAVDPPREAMAAVPAGSAAVKQAADEFDSRLRAAGIQSLKVEAEDGRVAARGRLTNGQAAQWAVIQRWFDQTYGSQVVLTANVVIGNNGPLLRLQAVWYGERPYIIADNGAHYYEGGVLDSGWIVTRISDERVLLSKDNETFALTYR